ncbi:MAG: hypothetical protein IPK65_01870 [Gammaproteobacteria bacterium]|nr:hypothetical protein [Gammaproteobacteria bacterium]
MRRISGHFLSEDREPVRIAVFGDPADPCALPVDGLARALAVRGAAVAVDDTISGVVTLVRPAPDGARAGAIEMPPRTGFEGLLARLRCDLPPELMLVTASPAAAVPCTLALFSVPVQTRGMRSAYLALKTLARHDTAPLVGATLTGARTRGEAAEGFMRFASATERFLGIRVASYSYTAAGSARAADGAVLDNIARMLLADLCSADDHRDTDGDPGPPSAYNKEQPWAYS